MIANEARSAELAIIVSYPTSVSGIIILLKNNPEILVDLVDSHCKKTTRRQFNERLSSSIEKQLINGNQIGNFQSSQTLNFLLI